MEPVTLAQLENFDPQPLRQGARTRYLCPLSGVCADKPCDNAHRSLCVENSTGGFYCHRCNERGRLREFWKEKKQSAKAVRTRSHLRPIARVAAETIVPAVGKKIDIEPLRERMKIYAGEFLSSPAEKYLLGRGISKEISPMALCGYAPAWEHWEKKNEEWDRIGTDRRVVFPVCDAARNLVAMHARAIDELHLHSPKITRGNKSRGVFYSSPDVFSSDMVAICEGPVDALALQACGIPAVAMIGTSAPEWLFEKLKDTAVLIATDADKAGDEAAMKLRFALGPHTKKVFRLRPLHGKDWAEELEMSGPKKLSEHLSPFSVRTDDAARANFAWEYFVKGIFETAEFIASLISDRELKESIQSLLYKERLRAA
jgi:DNA primase